MHNLLAAICSALRLGVSLDGCLKAAQSFKGVPGRLERVDGRSVCHVFVDYAHTDDALRNVLSVLRPLAKAQLIVVFGCGGDRDRGKRPLMARAVESLADVVFLTSDNPRTEDPDQIFADIRPGFFCPEKVIVEPDRRTAITMAITNAGPDDIVLLAGKGHEDYQVIGTEKKHFDDRECAAQVLTEVQQARENV